MNDDERLREIHDRIRALPTMVHRRIGQALWVGLQCWLEQIRDSWGERSPGAAGMRDRALWDCLGRVADLESLLSADQLGGAARAQAAAGDAAPATNG